VRGAGPGARDSTVEIDPPALVYVHKLHTMPSQWQAVGKPEPFDQIGINKEILLIR
jgi:hypothetical protein